MKTKQGRPSYRPSETVPFPALKNKIRIFLEKSDIPIHSEIPEPPKNKKWQFYIGGAIPDNFGTFFELVNECLKDSRERTYRKKKFFPRSVIVIVDELKVRGRGTYIDIPSGTPVFLCKMNELGFLSSIGPEFSGRAVTIIINPPDEETVKKYMTATE